MRSTLQKGTVFEPFMRYENFKRVYVDDCKGSPFPEPSAAESIDVPNGSFLNLLVLDMDAYAEQYGNKPIQAPGQKGAHHSKTS